MASSPKAAATGEEVNGGIKEAATDDVNANATTDVPPASGEVEPEGECVAVAPTQPTHEPFSLNVLEVCRQQQQQNGLRHNDYHRYRQYCARRLKRIRSSLKFKHGRSRYVAKAIPADFSDDRFLLLPLVNAERAWSYAVQLKATNAAAEQLNPRARLHSIRRFAKAVSWAKRLEQMCGIHCDKKTCIDAQAYRCWMQGEYHLEREEWQDAVDGFGQAKTLWEQLLRVSEDTQATAFKEKLDELDPKLRICRYHLGRLSADQRGGDSHKHKEGKTGTAASAASAGVLNDMSGGGASASADGDHTSWRGQRVVIPSEKVSAGLIRCDELRLSNCVDIDKATERDFEGLDGNDVIEKYGEISASYAEVLKQVHKDMINMGGDPDSPQWSAVESYVKEQTAVLNIERNLLLLLISIHKLHAAQDDLVRGKVKPEEGVRFCELIKENVSSALDLCPEYHEDADKASKLPISEGLCEALQSYLHVAANYRCWFVALCNAASGKLQEAYVLTDLALSRSDVSLPPTAPSPYSHIHTLVRRLQDDLPSRLRRWRARLAAKVVAQDSGLEDPLDKAASAGAGVAGASSASAAAAASTAAAAATTVKAGDLNAFPPAIEPIACKPLLFDLALSSFPPPDISHRVKKESKGLLGRFTSWWGGK